MARRWWRDRLGPIFAGLALAATVGTTPLARKLDLWMGDNSAAVTAPRLADPANGSIVFDIDDRSLAELTPLTGSWPYGRDVWAHVVDYLRVQGARGIVLDVLFAEPRAGDAQLAAALDRAPGTVIAAATVPYTLTADTANATSMAGLGWPVPADVPAAAWADVTAPRPELRRAGGIGVVNVLPDADGIVRRLTLIHRAGQTTLPAMGLAAVARRTGRDSVPEPTWTPTISGGILHVDGHAFPVDTSGSLELWYPKDLGSLATLRFDRLARAALTDAVDPPLAAMVRDRQVFVGASALMLDHTIQTPRAPMAGVGFVRLSATLLEQGHVLRPASWPWDLLLFIAAFAIPFAIDAARHDTPARLVAALPLAWIAIVGLNLALLVTFRQRTALVTPLVAAMGATAALGMQELLRLRRERASLVAERLAAERATDLKTRFLNHVAHELRTPLAAILGFSRLLGQDGAGTRERQEYAQVIFRNSTHLLRLVNNLLDDARLASGHAMPDPQPASVRQIVRDVLATIEGLPRGAGVAIVSHVDAGVPEWLMIDELRVRQIVINLVANAAKFTERGRIRIDATWVADRLGLAVEDTGTGIEPESREKVFEEFEFGSPSAARAGGSGLGLSVSRRLARMMGGDLVLEWTAMGEGSRFLLTIPALVPTEVPAPVAAAVPPPAPAAPAATAARQSGSVRAADWQPRILVCDDSPDIRQLLTVVLDRAGAVAEPVPTGADAIAAVARHAPDAVLLDLGLPDMSGLDVVTRLRSSGYAGPIIAATGGGDDLTPAALRERGFSDIVHKPTPGSVLVDVVSSHLPTWTPRRHRVSQAR